MLTLTLRGARRSHREDVSNCICRGAKELCKAFNYTYLAHSFCLPACVTAEIIKHGEKEKTGEPNDWDRELGIKSGRSELC